MLFALIGALVALAGGAYWHVSRRPEAAGTNPPPRAKAAQPKQGGRFGAVQIRAPLEACRAAQLLHGHRFLSKDAPKLPLPECSAERCSCTFSKLPDRRTDSRRFDQDALHTTLFIAGNRRTKHDRRRTRQRPR